MTICQILNFAVAKLKKHNINLPHLEAEILLSSLLKKPREFLFTHPEYKPTARQISNFKFQISKRLKGEPVAYLTGHKEFYGLNFMVNKNVLIPRPETELLVEEAIRLITHSSQDTAHKTQPVTLVDAGTGSGCLIIALAKFLKEKSGIMSAGWRNELWAIDISKKALAVAKKNAQAHGLNKKIKFIKGDLLAPLANNSNFKIQNSKLIVLANLPYGWKAWKNNCSLETVGLKFEPEIALFTGKNGLELYGKLFQQIKTLAAKLPAACYVLCEFDPRQTAKIKKLIKRKLPQAECQIKKDLSGLNRLAIITLPA